MSFRSLSLRNKHKTLAEHGAFTLVEVLVSLVVASMAMMIITSFLVGSFGFLHNNKTKSGLLNEYRYMKGFIMREIRTSRNMTIVAPDKISYRNPPSALFYYEISKVDDRIERDIGPVSAPPFPEIIARNVTSFTVTKPDPMEERYEFHVDMAKTSGSKSVRLSDEHFSVLARGNN